MTDPTLNLNTAAVPLWRCWLRRFMRAGLAGLARFITGARVEWRVLPAAPDQPTIYYANHASHGDALLVWSSLPPDHRAVTRPVAAADYWGKSPLRRSIAANCFNAVMIDRAARHAAESLDAMEAALRAGASLILFPEGTRRADSDAAGPFRAGPFRAGLWRLAEALPQVRLVPVRIDNLARVLPKGEFIPIPLLCSVTFQPPLARVEGEERDAFLERARNALMGDADAD